MKFTEPAVMEILLLCLQSLQEVLSKAQWLLPRISNSSEGVSASYSILYSGACMTCGEAVPS